MSQQRRHKRGHDPYHDVWHRSASLQRFLGAQRARWVSLIDIDGCEYCNLCYEPVALIEVKALWARTKVGTVTANLARRAGTVAYLVEYETHGPTFTCSECGRAEAADDTDEIVRFYVTQWWPQDGERVEYEPHEYADWLWNLRADHWRDECQHARASWMLERSEAA